MRAELVEILGMGATVAPAEPDASALDAIGIDLETVRRRVEEAFGPGALDRALSARPRGRRGRVLRRRRRVCTDGRTCFTDRAKRVLELSLRESLHLGHGYIGPEHILLGLLREGQGLAVQMLSRRGLSFDSIRSQVLEELGPNSA